MKIMEWSSGNLVVGVDRILRNILSLESRKIRYRIGDSSIVDFYSVKETPLCEMYIFLHEIII